MVFVKVDIEEFLFYKHKFLLFVRKQIRFYTSRVYQSVCKIIFHKCEHIDDVKLLCDWNFQPDYTSDIKAKTNP